MDDKGFTLVELIVVLLLISILSVMAGQGIVAPVVQYIDLSNRAALVNNSESFVRRIQRDIHHALPNSIRVSSDGKSLELLHVVDGGRYLGGSGVNTGRNPLDFSAEDDSFESLTPLQKEPEEGWFVVIYNTSATGNYGNGYIANGNKAEVGSGSTAALIQLKTPFRFPTESPLHRFFIVDSAVSYVCRDGQLQRFVGYDIKPNLSSVPDGMFEPVVDTVSTCQFSYNPGTFQRGGFVSVNFTLEKGKDSVAFYQQFHVFNSP